TPFNSDRSWNGEGLAGVAGPEHSLGGQSMDRLESSETHEKRRGAQVSRRSFMTQVAAGVAAAPLVGGALAGCAQATSPSARAGASGPSQRPPNILFLFTDQERYFPQLPAGYALPAQERLARTGVTFHNHYCPAVQCTPSRSVLLTGLQTADTGMFENTDLPWIKNLSTTIPTVGHMLRKAGYYTAYKGKWH